MPSEPAILLVSTQVLAALCGVTPRRVQQLAGEGVFVSAGHGQWNAVQCVPAFYRHKAQAEAARTEASGPGSRIRDLKADDLAMRIEERSRKLIREAEEAALALVDEMAGPLKSDLYMIIPRVTKDPALRRSLETEFDAAFTAAAKRAAKAAQAAGSPR